MKLINKLIAASLAIAFMPLYASAAELNLPGFTGTVNSTITSGFTMRTEDNECKSLPGYQAEMNANTVSPTAMTFLGLSRNPMSSTVSADKLALLTNFTNKNGAGCATSEVDGYGNTSYNPLYFGNQNADDGKMNFPDSGTVIDATQKMFTEISGYTDGGTGINLSFIGSVNPALDINDEDFVRMTSKAKSQFESDITLLDAYMTHSVDMPGGGYVDLSFGRLATSYGEATFLPIGMNGLVTSGLDLTKLRAPGASIRDAIIPTEQIVAAFQTGDWGVEAYYQFGHDPVKLDPKGAFYGSDIAGTGNTNLLASGGWDERDIGGDQACSYAYNVIELANSANGADLAALMSQCNRTSYDLHTAEATRHLYNTSELARKAQVNSIKAHWDAYVAIPAGAGGVYMSAIQAGGGSTSLPGYDIAGALVGFTSTNTTGLANNVYTESNIVQTDYNTGATVALAIADEKYKKPNDAHDFGFSAHKYFDDLGSGVDIGLYFANYTSKVPYAQVIGKGGVLAGDHVGMYKAQFFDYAGRESGAFDAADLGHQSGFDHLGKTRVTSSNIAGAAGAAGAAWLALANGAFGSGVAGGFTALSSAFDAFRKDGGNNLIAANSTTNFITKNYINQGIYGSVITAPNGRSKLYHNPQGAVSGAAGLYKTAGDGFAATTDLAFLSYGATLLPAITPLNLAQVQFVYPEDNQLFGASFNTNVNGTTVQGEISYRPDFKLGTALGDQINQISDASGASLALTLFAVESYQTTMEKAVQFGKLEEHVNATLGAGAIDNLVKGIERSSLPNLKALATSTAQQDYRSSAWIEYDTWSFDVGTTTSFSPSTELVQSIGADSAFLLTELGAVYINGMDNKKNGFVARNGFNEGAGEYLCLGIFQDLTDTQRADISALMIADGYTNFNIDYNLMEVGTMNKLSNGSNAKRSGAFVTAGAPILAGDDVWSGGVDTGRDYNNNAVGSRDRDSIIATANNSSLSNIGAGIVDAIFGNGNYCESQMGADELSMTYRIIGGATYNNINNSRWSLSPNFAWAHDFYGYGPSSLGGFVPGKQSLSLGVNLDKGDGLRVGFNYVAQLGELTENTGHDRDYVSANVSYAF
mgnify:CR=1 FL=1